MGGERIAAAAVGLEFYLPSSSLRQGVKVWRCGWCAATIQGDSDGSYYLFGAQRENHDELVAFKVTFPKRVPYLSKEDREKPQFPASRQLVDLDLPLGWHVNLGEAHTKKDRRKLALYLLDIAERLAVRALEAGT